MSLGWYGVSDPQERPLDYWGRQFGNDLEMDLVDLVDDTFVLGKVEVESNFLEGCVGFEFVMSKEELKALVATMYKRKGKKVLPVNIPLQGGELPGGCVNDEAIINFTADNAFNQPWSHEGLDSLLSDLLR